MSTREPYVEGETIPLFIELGEISLDGRVMHQGKYTRDPDNFYFRLKDGRIADVLFSRNEETPVFELGMTLILDGPDDSSYQITDESGATLKVMNQEPLPLRELVELAPDSLKKIILSNIDIFNEEEE